MRILDKIKKGWRGFRDDQNAFGLMIGAIIFAIVFFLGGSLFLWRLQEALASLVVCVFLLAIPLIALILIWRWSPTGRQGVVRVGRAVGGAGVHVIERGATIVKKKV